jgi:Glycosyltransferase family 87
MRRTARRCLRTDRPRHVQSLPLSLTSAQVDGGGSARHVRRVNRALIFVLLVVLPVCFYVQLLISYGDEFGFDLRYAYLPAAREVLAGSSPYPALTDPDLAHFHAFVYPPFLAYLVAPLLLLGDVAAAIVGVVAFLLLLGGAVYLCNVRDWRCYGVVLLWAPTFNAVQNLNVSLPLAFALAAAWRFRDRLWPFAATLGALIAVKLFLWPLLAWPLVTRRLRASVTSVLVAGGLVLGSWAIIGFAGLSGYPALVQRLTEIERLGSYSVAATVVRVGGPETLGDLLGLAIGGALLVAAFVYSRGTDDRRALTAALGASLALAPIVWQHYLVLLVVPLALARPRLSPAWFLPLLLWVSPMNDAEWPSYLRLPVPFVAALLLFTCLARPSLARRREAAGLGPLARPAGGARRMTRVPEIHPAPVAAMTQDLRRLLARRPLGVVSIYESRDDVVEGSDQ